MSVRQITQISESHCGPAVIQMLLDAIGIETSQNEVVNAAGASQTIEEHGTRIDQLAVATTKLAPHTQFWYKYHSNLDDIRAVLNAGYAVGVEWQGLFYESEREEEPDGDYGHYSIISHIDEERQVLVIVDPYKDFSNQNRIFAINTFLRRWWDTNEVYDPESRTSRIVEDVRLLFFITPDHEDFPPERGFKRFTMTSAQR